MLVHGAAFRFSVAVNSSVDFEVTHRKCGTLYITILIQWFFISSFEKYFDSDSLSAFALVIFSGIFISECNFKCLCLWCK